MLSLLSHHCKLIIKVIAQTESNPTSNPTSSECKQASYDEQTLILGSERHLLMFPHHWILHAEQTHKQPQQSS